MASPQHDIARRFLVERGLPVRPHVASLTALIVEAEKRGMDVAWHAARKLFLCVNDGGAQSGDDLADQHRPATPGPVEG